MRRWLRAVVAMLAGVAVTLVCVFVLLSAVLAITRIANPWLHGLAVAAALLLGVFLLMGSVYLATRFALRLLGEDSAAAPR